MQQKWSGGAVLAALSFPAKSGLARAILVQQFSDL